MNGATVQLNGVAITATAAEINEICDDTLGFFTLLNKFNATGDYIFFNLPFSFDAWSFQGTSSLTNWSIYDYRGIWNAGGDTTAGVWGAYKGGNPPAITKGTFLNNLQNNDRFYYGWNGWFTNDSGCDIWMGWTNNSTPGAPVAGDDYAAFHWDDGTLKFETSDGVTVQTTTPITFTAGTMQNFMIFRDSASVKAYLNGILVATHSTNIPDGGSPIPFIWCVGNSGGTKYIVITAPYGAINKADYTGPS